MTIHPQPIENVGPTRQNDPTSEGATMNHTRSYPRGFEKIFDCPAGRHILHLTRATEKKQ